MVPWTGVPDRRLASRRLTIAAMLREACEVCADPGLHQTSVAQALCRQLMRVYKQTT